MACPPEDCGGPWRSQELLETLNDPNHEEYEDFFERKRVNFISHYETKELKFPTEEQMDNLELSSHVWTIGDRLYKIAGRYYGNPKLWWVIAWFNRTPTEADVKLGYIINIPAPIDRVLGLLGL